MELVRVSLGKPVVIIRCKAEDVELVRVSLGKYWPVVQGKSCQVLACSLG